MTLAQLCKSYEKNNQTFLDKTKPIIIRLDGKGFSKLTKRLEKPYCDVFQRTMRDTLNFILTEIQGCIAGYQQSDEMTIIIDNYSKLDSEVYFGGRTDKILSVSASMATWYFNRRFLEIAEEELDSLKYIVNDREEYLEMVIKYAKSDSFRAMFDSRVFQCEINEAHKMIQWRQIDCYKNSISSFAQREFSTKELYGKSTEDRKQMLLERGINWEDKDFIEKYGYLKIYGWSDESNKNRFIYRPMLLDSSIKDIRDLVTAKTSDDINE